MKPLLIYGLGDFAKMIKYYFDNDSKYDVVAFCADKSFIKNDTFSELPLVAFEDVNTLYPSSEFTMFVAVGYSRMRTRKVMFERAIEKKYRFANYISSRANIDKNTVVGVNNAILQCVQIEPFCRIGNNNIIWSSVNICHDAIIGDNCFLASQSLVGGFSSLGDNSFVGFNATINQNLILAEETLVGAKTLIISDTKPFSKNIGIPSRCVSLHAEEGIIII